MLLHVDSGLLYIVVGSPFCFVCGAGLMHFIEVSRGWYGVRMGGG